MLANAATEKGELLNDDEKAAAIAAAVEAKAKGEPLSAEPDPLDAAKTKK